MRLHRPTERGSAMAVVLIITIMILLAFATMWFMSKDDLEKAQKAEKAAKAEEVKARTAAAAFLQYAEGLSRVVGNLKQNAEDLLPAEAKGFGGSTVLTKVDDLQGHLTPDGMVPGATEGAPAQPGLLNWLRTNAFVEIATDLRTGKAAEGVKEDRVDFGWMKPEFKAKLAEYREMSQNVPQAPKPPTDPDDAAAQAEYAQKLAEYEAAMKALRDVGEALAAMDGYKRFEQIIAGGQVITDEAGLVRLNFFSEGAEAQPTLLQLLEVTRKPLVAMKSEFIENKKADVARVSEVTQEKVALEESLQSTKKELEAEQGRHTADVKQLQDDLTAANAQVEANRVETTTALNRVTQLEEEKKQVETKAAREISARDERIRQDKAKRDLQIRRDDPDGLVTATSPTMRIGQINLGSADKVFVGLKFGVGYFGRGGLREPKGEVVVTRVTGPHSSQVAILGEIDPQNPIVTGDFVHNPLYSPSEEIRVFLAGPLQKWPKQVLVDRLRKMGVVVDDALNGKTDYVIVPDSMTAPAAAPAAEGEDGGEEAPKAGQSDFERISSQARAFGATVVSESLLDAFLNI